MAEVRNCKQCGKLFTYIGGQSLCIRCRKEEELQFKKVKEYLYENPGATITEIAMELDVSVKKIKYYLREGRLEIINDEGNLMLECERCGKAIKTGRYCDACQRELASQLKGVAEKMKKTVTRKKEEFGVRFADKDRRNS